MDFFIPTVSAAGAILDPSRTHSPGELIQTGVALVVLVAGLCSILFIVWGGLMLILSGGKDEKVKPAINSIRYAVIGIIVIVISLFLAPELMKLLGLGNYEHLSPGNIFEAVKNLMTNIFGGGWSSGSTPSINDMSSKFEL